MELHPTPESWRVALITAIGATLIMVGGALGAASGWGIAWCWWIVVGAGLATVVPAVGTVSARVDADERGVTVRRFGRARRFAWSEVAKVAVIERRASVPDGTEYHWLTPSRRPHVVAVPTLELTDGRVRQLSALATPIGASNATATVERLRELRGS